MLRTFAKLSSLVFVVLVMGFSLVVSNHVAADDVPPTVVAVVYLNTMQAGVVFVTGDGVASNANGMPVGEMAWLEPGVTGVVAGDDVVAVALQ